MVITRGSRPGDAVPNHAGRGHGVWWRLHSCRFGRTHGKTGSPIAVLIAATVQLVSPWNEAASLYTRYVRATEKQRRKGQVA